MRQVPGVSLQRKLLLWLLLPQLVLWLSGGFLAWRIALQNGEKGIDQTLTQSVRALARQIKPIGDGLLVDFPKAAQDILEQDPADRITYMVSSPPGRFLLGNAQLAFCRLCAAQAYAPERGGGGQYGSRLLAGQAQARPACACCRWLFCSIFRSKLYLMLGAVRQVFRDFHGGAIGDGMALQRAAGRAALVDKWLQEWRQSPLVNRWTG